MAKSKNQMILFFSSSLKAAFSQRKQHKHKVKHHLRSTFWLFLSLLLLLCFLFFRFFFCCINWFSASQTRNHQVLAASTTFLSHSIPKPMSTLDQFCSRLRSPSCNFLCGTQHTHITTFGIQSFLVSSYPPFFPSVYLVVAVSWWLFDPLNPFCEEQRCDQEVRHG